jgi:hypothetical protein
MKRDEMFNQLMSEYQEPHLLMYSYQEMKDLFHDSIDACEKEMEDRVSKIYSTHSEIALADQRRILELQSERDRLKAENEILREQRNWLRWDYPATESWSVESMDERIEKALGPSNE